MCKCDEYNVSLTRYTLPLRVPVDCNVLHLIDLLICRRQEHTERKTIEIQTQQCQRMHEVYSQCRTHTFSHTFQDTVCKRVCVDKGIKYRLAIKIHSQKARRTETQSSCVQMTEFTWFAHKLRLCNMGELYCWFVPGTIGSICARLLCGCCTSFSLPLSLSHIHMVPT